MSLQLTCLLFIRSASAYMRRGGCDLTCPRSMHDISWGTKEGSAAALALTNVKHKKITAGGHPAGGLAATLSAAASRAAEKQYEETLKKNREKARATQWGP